MSRVTGSVTRGRGAAPATPVRHESRRLRGNISLTGAAAVYLLLPGSARPDWRSQTSGAAPARVIVDRHFCTGAGTGRGAANTQHCHCRTDVTDAASECEWLAGNFDACVLVGHRPDHADHRVEADRTVCVDTPDHVSVACLVRLTSTAGCSAGCLAAATVCQRHFVPFVPLLTGWY